MKAVLKASLFGLALSAVAGMSGGARAAPPTPLTAGTAVTITTGTTYSYGDTEFDFTACNSCTGLGSNKNASLEVEAISNGRGGTEIELLTNKSYIFNSTVDSTLSLNFTLEVLPQTGSNGVNKVTNIVNGTNSNPPTNNANVNSVLSAFSPSAGTIGGQQTSSLASNSQVSTLSNTVGSGSNFTFKDTLTVTAASGYTLQLTSVQLLLNPAPEPASMAVFGAGLIGLTAAKRRWKRGRTARIASSLHPDCAAPDAL